MCLESPSLRSLPDVFLFALWVSVESTVGQKSQDHPGHVLLPAASMTVLLNLLLGMVSVHTFHCVCLHTSLNSLRYDSFGQDFSVSSTVQYTCIRKYTISGCVMVVALMVIASFYSTQWL